MISAKKLFTSFVELLLLIPVSGLAQKQYYLPTDDKADEKDRPMIEVYLPNKDKANGCAVVLCPGGAMRWLMWKKYLNHIDAFSLNTDTARLVRLFFQPVLIAWALWSTGGWAYCKHLYSKCKNK